MPRKGGGGELHAELKKTFTIYPPYNASFAGILHFRNLVVIVPLLFVQDAHMSSFCLASISAKGAEDEVKKSGPGVSSIYLLAQVCHRKIKTKL